MATVNRTVETPYDRDMALKWLATRKPPFTLTLTEGKHRSTDQNRLQRLWVKEIAEQLGDQTAEEVRGQCKLQFGVPILRSENEAFRAAYDRSVKPLPYEQKLALMMEPISLPITSIMTAKQKTAYLDAIHRHYSAQGIVLTDPDPMGLNQIARAS